MTLLVCIKISQKFGQKMYEDPHPPKNVDAVRWLIGHINEGTPTKRGTKFISIMQ